MGAFVALANVRGAASRHRAMVDRVVQCRFGDEGFAIVSDRDAVEQPWASVVELWQFPRRWLLLMGSKQWGYLILPTADLTREIMLNRPSLSYLQEAAFMSAYAQLPHLPDEHESARNGAGHSRTWRTQCGAGSGGRWGERRNDVSPQAGGAHPESVASAEAGGITFFALKKSARRYSRHLIRTLSRVGY